MTKRVSGQKPATRKPKITLSPEAAAALDRLATKPSERAALVEQAILELAAREGRKIRDARELQILNENVERLTTEAEDVLAFQAGI